MQIGDLVRVYNERGLNELGYIKKFGRYGKSHIMVVYLTGTCIGMYDFIPEKDLLPIKQLTGEERV
jgi:hypothetical protein